MDDKTPDVLLPCQLYHQKQPIINYRIPDF